MESHTIFCSACDRDVRVLITAAPSTEGQAPLHDEEVVCLEIGEQCTGSLCPIGASATDAMVGRLVRNGVPIGDAHTVHSLCPACDLEVDMVMYGDGRAACSACGTVSRWRIEHAPLTPG